MKPAFTTPPAFPTMAEDLELPEPDFPLYDLTALEDPPAGWKCVGYTTRGLIGQKTLKAGPTRTLAKFHLWGIRYHDPNGQGFKKNLCKALWKYFYHMQEQHRPQKWMDLFNLARDAGPRLLKWTLDPRPPPISLHYLEMPPATFATMEELASFKRPEDALTDIPDTHVAQMMYSAAPLDPSHDLPPQAKRIFEGFDRLRKEKHTEKRPVETSENDQPHKKRRIHEFSSPSDSATLHALTSTLSPPDEDSFLPDAPLYDDNPPTFGTLSPPLDLPSGISPPRQHIPPRTGSSLASPDPTNSSVGPPPEEPEFIPDSLRVDIEKLIMKHTYVDLQRHPHAPHQEPIPNQIASDPSHLGIVQSGAFSSIRAVRINVENLEFSQNGFEFPYRGRGPVGTTQSCYVDCVIMVGKLLDAGCTVGDRKEGRNGRFTDIERAFIEITNMNWDAFDEKVSGELRDSFHRLLCTTYPQLMIGHLCPPWSAWSVCTKHFEQFRFYYTTEKTRCLCKGGSIKSSEKHGCFIGNYLADEDSRGVKVSTLVERSWPARKAYTCKDCGAGDSEGGPSISKRITRLPLRLVVIPICGTKLLNHTDNVEFKYLNADGKVCKATYRWLGGIYFHGEHARVWWTDAARGEMDLGDVRLYDGTQVSGTMFGGIPASDINERVDPSWAHNAECPPMLFYEQVLNPTIDVCFTAMDTIHTMGQFVQQEKPVLLNHVPWVPAPPPPIQRYPGRYLPSFGDVFFNAQRPDPFDTLPPDAAFIDVRDWAALRRINDKDPRLDPFKEQMALVPYTFGQPPSPPPETQFFDTLLKSPLTFVDQPDMWSQGLPDAAGLMYFPELPQLPDSRPVSKHSQSSSGASRFTFADWLVNMKCSPRGSSSSKKSRSTDTTMGDASSSRKQSAGSEKSGGSANSEGSAKNDHHQGAQTASHVQRSPPEHKQVANSPSSPQIPLRPIRKTVLIRNANRKRARFYETLGDEFRHLRHRRA